MYRLLIGHARLFIGYVSAQLGAPLPPGTPSEAEMIAMYCARANRPPPSQDEWAFYCALCCHRQVLTFLHGVYVFIHFEHALGVIY